MTDRCPKCGALYSMVGRVHRCVSSGTPTDEAKAREPRKVVEAKAPIPRPKQQAGVGSERSSVPETKPNFDRVSYQREYMRQWRAKRGKK